MSSQIIGPNSEAAILARLIQKRQEDFSRDVSEYLLSIQFDESDTERMNELAERARNKGLADDERAELDSYLHVSNLLAVMQSRARHSLQESEAGRPHS